MSNNPFAWSPGPTVRRSPIEGAAVTDDPDQLMLAIAQLAALVPCYGNPELARKVARIFDSIVHLPVCAPPA